MKVIKYIISEASMPSAMKMIFDKEKGPEITLYNKNAPRGESYNTVNGFKKFEGRDPNYDFVDEAKFKKFISKL